MADKQFTATNERAATAIDANVALLREAGVRDIVRVPVLYTYKELTTYYMLKQEVEHTPPGPERDKLQKELDSLTNSVAEVTKVLTGIGLRPKAVDDFLALRLESGEFHCGTNTYRRVSI